MSQIKGFCREMMDEAEEYKNPSEPCFGFCLDGLGNFFGCLCTGLCCGSCCYPYKTVNLGWTGVIQRFGKLKKIVSEGFHYVNPITETMNCVDMRTQYIILNSQIVLTGDNLSINIDGVVYYRIIDIQNALFSVNNISSAIDQLAHATLRNVFGKHSIQECLENREKIANEIQKDVSEQIMNWGVKIESIQIKDIIIPTNIQKLLSSAATAERESRAKIISAQADVEAAKLMRTASDILNSNAAMQIRYLETLNKIAESDNAKVIFISPDYKQIAGNIASQEMMKETY
jgi:erythrocyte band 7 integral membrane protein